MESTLDSPRSVCHAPLRFRAVTALIGLSAVTMFAPCSAQPGTLDRLPPVELSWSLGFGGTVKSWDQVMSAASQRTMNPDNFGDSSVNYEGQATISIPVKRQLRLDVRLVSSAYAPFALNTGRKTYYSDYRDESGSRGVWCRVFRRTAGVDALVLTTISGGNGAGTIRIGGGLGIYRYGANLRPYAKVATYTLSGRMSTRKTAVAPVIRVSFVSGGRGRVFLHGGVTATLLGDRELGPVAIQYDEMDGSRASVTVNPKNVPFASYTVSIGLGVRIDRG